MKASKYNIYVKKKHGVICFNTFHDIYSFMSAELYELILLMNMIRLVIGKKNICLRVVF